MSLGKQEEVERQALEDAMRSAECKHYQHGEVVVDMRATESAFVKIEKPKT